MRFALALLVGAATSLACAQLSVGESRALDDAMTLANLRPEDLRGIVAPPGARAGQVAALRDPLAGLNEAASLHARAAGDESATLRAAFGLLGSAVGKGGSVGGVEVPATVPAPLRRPVGQLVAAIAAANSEIRSATARLSPDERRLLIESLPRLAADDATLPLDFAKAPTRDFATIHRLLDLVDTARIESAGIVLADAVRDAIPALQAIPQKAISPLTFRVQGVLVELTGSGPDNHVRRDVGLCIDLGGNDRYTGRYGAGIGYAGVLIDLGGNDRYMGPDANFGTGLLGIGLLYDGGGEDVYGVRSVGLGCGLAGVGELIDSGGDDRYRVVSMGLGCGVRGIGLLSDRLGDDAYESGRDGEGFGALGGVGWLAEGGGNDVYRGGEQVQAAGREGGFGLLSDLGGNDLYRADRGQAWTAGGYASLGDLSGDDDYSAQSGQAFASAGGVSFMIEGGGDDSYLLKRGPGQAAAFGGVAILLDRAGDDVYGGTDGTPATAVGGGVGILLEADGDDRYLASAPFRKDADGVALWVDGRGRDRYGDGRTDAQALASGSGAAYDAYGATEPVSQEPPPKPNSLPMPSAAEFAALVRRASDGPDQASAMGRLVGIGLPALEALVASPEGGATFVAVACRMGPDAAPIVARLAKSDDPRLVRMALATAGFVPLPSEAVVGALEKPEMVLPGAEAAGRDRTVAAVPLLMRLAGSTEPRAAVVALAAIADPQSASSGAALLDHADPVVRRAAFRLALLRPEVAFAAGVRLAEASDGFRQRIGLALLGALGTPAALEKIGPYLDPKKGRDAQIGALLALDGHVPPGLIPAVEALRRDQDALVRAVAERIDAG